MTWASMRSARRWTDLERALAHLAKGRRVGDRVIDIKQEQASNLRRFRVVSALLGEEVFVGLRFALLFELLHVIAKAPTRLSVSCW